MRIIVTPVYIFNTLLFSGRKQSTRGDKYNNTSKMDLYHYSVIILLSL